VKLLLVGAGGHAQTVFELALRCGHSIPAYIDSVRALRPWLERSEQLDGDDQQILGNPGLARSAEGFVMGLGGVKPEQLAHRFSLFERYAMAFAAQPPALVHPAAVVADRASVSPGVQVMAGAILNPGATIGRAAIVNSGAIVEHEAVVEAGAHIAPGAIVLGGATVGAGAMVGAGAVVLPGTEIAAGVMVPALTRVGGVGR
jgi:sugar O-acyltransferase (sialic acid O-acetyltransferase NeuD family)